MWNHYVVRANTPLEPFKDFESARLTWKSLYQVFPEMISAVLMPNHLHLILPQKKEPDKDLQKLGGILSGISRQKDRKKMWQLIPPPAPIPDRYHLRRQIRYVALNPCRKKLCSDPLEWYWSTHRDIVGATVERSESATRLAMLLEDSEGDFQVRFHSYVSGDPSVSVIGTPFPVPARRRIWANESIGEILAASAGALRARPADVRKKGPLRSLFIHLAYRYHWDKPSILSEICGISTRAVHRMIRQPSPPGLVAAELCLGDPRLRPKNPFSDEIFRQSKS